MHDSEFKSEEERLAAFAMLRRATHERMKKELMSRKANNPHPTEVELRLKAFVEELEPQVRDALRIFVEKGYTPNSSGFYGKNGERQVIDGNFDLREEEQRMLEEAGASVTQQVFGGEKEFSIEFNPKSPDLHTITQQWNKIAMALPDRGHMADPSINGDFQFLHKYAPERTDIEARIIEKQLERRDRMDPGYVPELKARLKEIKTHELNNMETIERILISGSEVEKKNLQTHHKLSNEQLDRLIHFATMRFEIHQETNRAFQERQKNNPNATEEELDLGIYLEAIEPQVRNAIRTLHTKGYATFESGFSSAGEIQMIGFEQNSIPDFSAFPQSLLSEIALSGLTLTQKDHQLILTPQRSVSADELEYAWNKIASALPDLHRKASLSTTKYAESFRKKQQIKNV